MVQINQVGKCEFAIHCKIIGEFSHMFNTFCPDCFAEIENHVVKIYKKKKKNYA